MPKDVPMMPPEFAGAVQKGCGYTKTAPRTWTKPEIDWMKKLQEQGYSNKEIAVSLGRTEVSVSIKAKRLGKSENTYNARHVAEKYEINERFLEEIQPRTVLDLYCGEASFYRRFDRLQADTNDIDASIDADYHEDAFRLICKLYYEGKKYDLVDLDPFGSAYDCFDIAVKMAKRGLAITLGELGHKRWKRLDFVGPHYGIETLEDFTIENIIRHIQNVGRRNKKELDIYASREWQNIGRVWLKVRPIKVTEQWGKPPDA